MLQTSQRRLSYDLQMQQVSMMPSNVTSQHVVLDIPNLAFTSFPTTLPCRGSSLLMYHEIERLLTFENWPLLFIQPETLSKAGFYYTKRSDIVRCPFCNVEVKDWEEGDDPMSDHRKWSSSCAFLINPEGCGNVPIPPDLPATRLSDPPSPADSGYDTCGIRDIRGMDPLKKYQTSAEIKNSFIYKSRSPSFPQFASLEERLKSFSSWPVSLKIKPNVLSDAGFYYTGKGDQTICFYCGGGLKDWEDSDDPWVEHAKWFSKCTFVLLTKGEEFVEKAKDSISMNKSIQGDSVVELSCNASSSVQDAGAPANTPDRIEEKDPVASSSTTASSSSPVNDAMMCKLCYSKPLEVLFLPCGHLMSCIDCSVKLPNCGMCRKPIKDVARVFVS